MLTGKQKSYLRSLGNTTEPILQVGKGGINANLVQQVVEALEARELIKLTVLNNSPLDVEETAAELARESGAELVQVIGHHFLLYKPSRKDPKIILP